MNLKNVLLLLLLIPCTCADYKSLFFSLCQPCSRIKNKQMYKTEQSSNGRLRGSTREHEKIPPKKSIETTTITEDRNNPRVKGKQQQEERQTNEWSAGPHAELSLPSPRAPSS